MYNYLCLLGETGTWWTRIVTEWIKLSAHLYEVCTVFSEGKWCVSDTREGYGQTKIVYSYHTLNYAPLPLPLPLLELDTTDKINQGKEKGSIVLMFIERCDTECLLCLQCRQ